MLNWLFKFDEKIKKEESKPSYMYTVQNPVEGIPAFVKYKFSAKGIDYIELHNLIDDTTKRY